MGVEKHIKCINFDLDTKRLLKIFPNGTRESYALIKKFFEDRGFEHRQYSGYISKNPLSEYQIDNLAKELGQKFIWLKTCMQEFDVSNAPDRVSIMEQIANSAMQQEKRNNLNKSHINTQEIPANIQEPNQTLSQSHKQKSK